MGIFDLFNSAPTPQPAPQSQVSGDPDQNAWIRNYINGAVAKQKMSGDLATTLFGWGLNNARDAATASAPGAWDLYKQGQAQSQSAQLNNAQSIAAAGAMTGTNIDPNNINGAIPAMQKAFGGAFGTPGPSGNNADGSPVTPLQQQRAMAYRLYNLYSRMPGMAPVAKGYHDIMIQGIPEHADVTADGRVVDPVSGKYLSGDVGQVLAAQAQPTEAMKTGFANRHSAFQGNVDVGVKKAEDADAATYDTIPGYSTSTGQPTLVSRADFRNGQAPNFAPGDNPYTAKHSTEIENAQKDATDANNAIIQLRTLQQALKGIHTGAGGQQLQDIRRSLASVGFVSPDNATAGDIANQIGTEVAALRARAASGGRTALGTFNIFRNVKPGVLSTNPDAQINALIPAYQRQIDYGNFASRYYGAPQNWNKLDAATAFQNENPDQKYVNAAGLGGPPPPSPESVGLSSKAMFLGWHQGKAMFSDGGKKFLVAP